MNARLLCLVLSCAAFFSSAMLLPNRVLAQAETRHSHAQPDVNAEQAAPSKLATNWTAQLRRVVTLQDYNTRVVALGTMLLGVSAGVIGVFMLLRRRSLVGDVVSHASLPGIAIAFLVVDAVSPGNGKWMPGLLVGATIAGLLGILCTTAICSLTRIKEDAALAIVLSVFFGLGISLLTLIQSMPTGGAAGLNQFIFGEAAALVAQDVKLILYASLGVLVIAGLFFKEMTVLCFDQRFAAAQGWPVVMLDLLLMSFVVGVTVIGLQSVGLLLVVAMLIIPAAAARFWSDRLFMITIIAGMLGGLSALFGVFASAMMPHLPAGAVIVLMSSLCFIVSMFAGKRRGIVRRWLTLWRIRRKVAREHLLRSMYEICDKNSAEIETGTLCSPVKLQELEQQRAWGWAELTAAVRRTVREGSVEAVSRQTYRLTATGQEHARRLVREHRLWELFLIHFADIAPSHVDRDADQIEHILEADMIDELERLLAEEYSEPTIPTSPHELPGRVPTS